MNNISQNELRSILFYNKDTGLFTWKQSRNCSIKVGGIAGSMRTDGYIAIKLNNRSYKAHRLAFLYIEGIFPEGEVDHIDRMRYNNRWSNIRKVTKSENLRNAGLRKGNTSGFTGVNWHSVHGKWHAQIRVNNRVKHLGYFEIKQDAIKARKAANIKYGYYGDKSDEQ